MSTHSGLLYYYDLLGLDPESYRLHYRFDEQNSAVIPNSAPLYSPLSGASNHSTSGNFSSTRVYVSGATGLQTDESSHIFMLDRRSSERCVVFDSLRSGAVWSGYRIGINDNNQPFFEFRGLGGPTCLVANLPSAAKNIYGVVKSASLLTFYRYDFYNEQVDSSSFPINGDYCQSSNYATIGSGANYGGQYVTGNLSGIVKDYLIISEALSPQSFKLLCSGLVSSIALVAAPVSSFSGVETTGYSTGITGATGVLRYETAITGSGLNPFGTGEYEYYYGPSGVTGYFTSGLSITPLTGYVTRYITGSASSGVLVDSSLVNSFRHDEISVLAEYSTQDILVSNYNWNATDRNLEGEFDDVNAAFSLPEQESESGIAVFINGILQFPAGYSVTGDFYQSGIVLSGDYRLDGRRLDSTGFYSLADHLQYDRVTKTGAYYDATGLSSGTSIPLPATGELYINGVLLSSGVDYSGLSSTTIISTGLVDITGRMVYFPLASGDSVKTGQSSLSGGFWAGAQKLWMNGVRLDYNRDYVENCSLDLLSMTGTLEIPTTSIFDNSQLYFE